MVQADISWETGTMIANNEFSEQFTGDMESMDSAYHYWMQDKYKVARLQWERNKKGDMVNYMNVDGIIAKTIQREGGYVNDKNDKGGETNFGISKRQYPKLDIKELTEADAIAIYKEDYWNKLNLSLLISEVVAEKIFDMCVNLGPHRAIEIAQEIVGARKDGILGSESAYLINTQIPTQFVAKLREKQVEHYVNLAVNDPSQMKFLRGWVRRAFA
jgi:lysozyme family protein